ncbi:MAG TPA: alpha/beta hydrolase [Nocardioides sp.]|nr:alpha/beta hydrolase [Nocardioides sp.]
MHPLDPGAPVIRGDRPSLQARALGIALRCTVKPVVEAWATAPDLPWPYALADQAGRLTRLSQEILFEEVALPHCRAQWITGGEDNGRVILYLHGGAFIVGGWHLHRHMLSELGRRTGARIFAVEYRKAPKHSIDDSGDDALAAYRHLLAEGVSPADIVVMGDSAGGYLSIQLAARLPGERLPAPAAVVALSPLLELDRDEPGTAGCAILSPRAIRSLSRWSRAATTRPQPMHSVRPTLPPILLQVGAGETLRRQVVAFAGLLGEQGVPHALQLYPTDIHVFHAALFLPEARAAFDAIVEFVDEVVGACSVPAAAHA